MRFSICIAMVIFLIAAELAAQTGAFILPQKDGRATPWKGTEKTGSSVSSFQFAVVADRTGGMQLGVFHQAVKKLNLLQPEFVISVGDLIDGYTRNADVVHNQWDEFDAIIGELRMPFFYIPGNHDFTNEVLADIWIKRLGESYYHFLYEHVLFLCLNTEDRNFYGISNDQAAYFENVLNTYRDVRWTFVFMHRPLWDYGDKAGYEHIETALQGREYTLFSGHHHNYVKKNRNGKNHFVLATTGGGSELRGVEFGELHHVVWVTVSDTMPVIANLAVDGIYDENIVIDKDYPLVETLRHGNWLVVKPLIADHEETNELHTRLTIKNPTERSLQVAGELLPQQSIIFEPGNLELSVPAESEREIPVTIKHISGRLHISQLSPVTFTLNSAFQDSRGQTLQLPASKTLLLDWIHVCEKRTNQLTIDGLTDDWENANWIDVNHPQDIAESWDWHGTRDGFFQFAVFHDAQYLYIGLKATDDRILPGSSDMTAPQDRFTIYLAPLSGDDDHILIIELAADPHGHFNIRHSGVTNDIEIRSAGKFTDHTFSAELAIPGAILRSGSEKFRLNVAYMDHDNPDNVKPSVLYWRPRWDSSADYAGSGTFVWE